MSRRRRTALPALVAVVTAALLALGGCGSSDGGSDAGGSTASSTDASSDGSYNDADVAFATGMIPHHEQALQMVAMAQGRDLSPDFETLIGNIYDAQQPEIDEMQGWLAKWSEPSSSATGHDMSGMSDMPGMSGSAPGMMSDDDLAELTNTSDRSAFEEMWLTMMIAHHEGAIEMAQTELDEGSYPPALDLAQSIVDSQSAEIDQMKQMLQG